MAVFSVSPLKNTNAGNETQTWERVPGQQRVFKNNIFFFSNNKSPIYWRTFGKCRKAQKMVIVSVPATHFASIVFGGFNLYLHTHPVETLFRGYKV